MKFDVLNRWTGKTQFTAEIDCAEDAPRSVRLGLTLQWAEKLAPHLIGESRTPGASW